MKIALVYFTRFGNNKIISDALAERLKEKGAEVSIAPMADTRPGELPEADLYVFGSPTQIGGPPLKVNRFVKKARLTAGASFAVVATCADETSKTAEKLSEQLEAKGLRRAVDNVTVMVKDLKGPLEENWEAKIDALAARIADG